MSENFTYKLIPDEHITSIDLSESAYFSLYDLIRNVDYRSFIQKFFFTLNFFLKRQTCKHSVHLKGVCFLLGNLIFVIYDTYQVIVQGIQCFNICSLYLFSFIYTDIVMVFLVTIFSVFRLIWHWYVNLFLHTLMKKLVENANLIWHQCER